jgi:hypothetical protein
MQLNNFVLLSNRQTLLDIIEIFLKIKNKKDLIKTINFDFKSIVVDRSSRAKLFKQINIKEINSLISYQY